MLYRISVSHDDRSQLGPVHVGSLSGRIVIRADHPPGAARPRRERQITCHPTLQQSPPNTSYPGLGNTPT